MKREKPITYNPVKKEKKAYDRGFADAKEIADGEVEGAYNRGYRKGRDAGDIKGQLDGEARERKRIVNELA